MYQFNSRRVIQGGAAHMIRAPTPDDNILMCSPTSPNLPSFAVQTIHISCQSDAYQGPNNSYAGILIYSCDGNSEWQTANGTNCKCGYLVIMDTGTEKVRAYQGTSPGLVHGAVYRSAFGEECTARNVVAEGFSVMNGVFGINSGVFNPAQDGYHDNERSMHSLSAACIKEVVDYWMEAGESFLNSSRNFTVENVQFQLQPSMWQWKEFCCKRLRLILAHKKSNVTACCFIVGIKS